MLETIFEYRALLAKCERGDGLDVNEIGRLMEIEADYAPRAEGPRGRKFRREIVEIGPGGIVCRKAPYIARGEQVEIVVDTGDRIYRLRAQGVWLKDDGEDYIEVEVQ